MKDPMELLKVMYGNIRSSVGGTYCELTMRMFDVDKDEAASICTHFGYDPYIAIPYMAANAKTDKGE